MKSHEQLVRKKVELEQRIKAIKADLGAGLDKDSEEQAQQLENYEVLLTILKNAENELQQVNNELIRLGDNV